MADEPATHSITLFDRHVEHRELQAHFFPNEVAIVVGEVGPTGGAKAACTLDREQAAQLRDNLTRWLDGDPIQSVRTERTPRPIMGAKIKSATFSCPQCRKEITGYPCVRCGFKPEAEGEEE